MEKRIGVKIKVFGQVDLREFESLDKTVKEVLNGLSFPCEVITIAELDNQDFPLVKFSNGVIISQYWLRTAVNKESLEIQMHRTKGVKG